MCRSSSKLRGEIESLQKEIKDLKESLSKNTMDPPLLDFWFVHSAEWCGLMAAKFHVEQNKFDTDQKRMSYAMFRLAPDAFDTMRPYLTGSIDNPVDLPNYDSFIRVLKANCY